VKPQGSRAEGLWTAGVGKLGATLPGCVYGTVDCRHPDEVTLAKMDQEESEDGHAIAVEGSLELKLRQLCSFQAVPCYPDGVAAVRHAVVRLAHEQGD
jgi:acetylornithine deacetylase/succinyl-diaminopimelate desuccinylase-like protein